MLALYVPVPATTNVSGIIHAEMKDRDAINVETLMFL